MLTMAAAGQPIDLITLSEAMRSSLIGSNGSATTELDAIGGPAALALLEEHASIAVHVDAYMGIVREKAIRRELIQGLTGVITRAYNDTEDIVKVLDETRSRLDRLAARSVVAAPAFQAMTLKALLRLDIPDPAFLVDGWIREASLSFVVGDSEALKSWFVLYMLFCIAAGVPMLNKFPVRQAPVLLISEENGLAEDRRRAAAMARGMGFDPEMETWHIASDAGFSFDDPAKYASMRAYIQEHSIRLVAVDSFVRVHRREERDAGQMNALYLDRIKPLIRNGVAIVALHHKRKMPSGVSNAPVSDNDDIRGSGDIRAAAHSVLFLRPASDTKVVVKHNKARGSKRQEPYVFGLRDLDTGGVELTHEGEPVKALDRSEACRVAILEFAQARGTFFREDVIKALKGKFSKKVLDPQLKELAAKGYPLTSDEVKQGRTWKLFFTTTSAGTRSP